MKSFLSLLFCSVLVLSNVHSVGATNIKSSTISTTRIPPKTREEEKRERKYKKYKKINSDTIGWIYVPNTVIDYPVVYSEDNIYYLSHAANKKPDKAGAIFMDFSNVDKNNQRNIILYGQNMNNGSMFNALNSYKDKKFFEENKLITLYFDKEKRQYEVYASFVANSDLPLVQVEFESDETFLNYMKNLQQLSEFETNPKTILNSQDEILTLMTSTYEYDNMRYVVQARRVDKTNDK